MKICIDYGHCLTGADTGAYGNNRREQDCTREIGRKLTSKLRTLGHVVTETNVDTASSESDSLIRRKSIINNSGCDLSISIHLNAGGGTGAEIFVDGYSNSIAQSILNRIVALGYPNRGIKDGNKFAVVGGVNPKAMLIECCFIDSANDMNRYNAESFANAIAKGIDSNHNTTSTPNPTPTPTPSGNVGKYLNLDKSEQSWRVYPLNANPVVGNECGKLAPAQFGGLSYKIEKDFGNEVFQITTSSFGVVKIVGCIGNGGSITSNAIYGGSSTPAPSNKKYLNLHPHVSSWRVYKTNVSPYVGNECGSLAPKQYGGLSYEIIDAKGDIKVINTSSFGKVQIFAPRDADSSITSSPIY